MHVDMISMIDARRKINLVCDIPTLQILSHLIFRLPFLSFLVKSAAFYYTQVIFGSTSPFYESLVLALGAEHVTVVEVM